MSLAPPSYPLLILDASSKRCFVGVKRDASHLDFIASEREASQSIFDSTRTLLQRNSLKVSSLKSIAFCAGPGSMLGIRTSVMAIRTWADAGILKDATLFFYNALALGSRMLLAQPETPDRFIVATDARRQAWNTLEVDRDAPEAEIAIMENAQLEAVTLPVFTFEEFASWTQTKAALTSMPYHCETLFEDASHFSVFQATQSPEPLSLRPSEYKKWVPTFTPPIPASE